MSRNIYSEPRIFIGTREITQFSSVTYSQKGNSKAAQLSVTLTDPELDDASLVGKDILFFLNHGSSDSVPFFRGIIKSYNPTDKSVSLTALDALSLLSGRNSLPLVMTDKVNYDGYTLGQMLYDYISTYINAESTKIGLDMLNDSSPIVSLSGERQKNTTPIKLIQSTLSKVRDDDDYEDIRVTRLIVRDDGVKSNVVFVKEQSINDAGIKFSFNDGIEKINYKRRQSPNYFVAQVNDSIMKYQHNSLPTGIHTQTLKGNFEYPDEASEQAFVQATKAENEKEISIQVSKGHYLEIGNVINLQLSEHPELTGKHRIVGKKIQVSGSKMSCSLDLNKDAPTLSNYLQST